MPPCDFSTKHFVAERQFTKFFGMLRLLMQILLATILSSICAYPLTLSEAIEQATDENRAIVVLRQQLAETATLKSQAESAYLPQFELNGTYSYMSRLPELKLGEQLPIALPQIDFATHHAIDFNLSGGYLLYDWGKRGKRVSQAELVNSLQELKLDAAKQEVAYQTTKAYAAAGLAAERVELMLKYVENADRHLADAQSKYENDLISEFDLLKSELQLKIFSEELAVARAELRQSLLRLSEIVGADSGSVVVVDQPLSEIDVEIPTVQQVSELLKHKPEVQLARKQVELSELQVDIEKLRPRVTLFTSAGWRNNYLPDPDELLFNFTGGAKVSYRFFDGGLSHHKQAEEQAKQVRLQLESKQVINEASRTIEVAREELLKIEAKRAATVEKLSVAKKALNIASVSYGVGLITNSEYLDTELEIQQIELEALKDRFDLLSAQLELKKAAGYWPEAE